MTQNNRSRFHTARNGLLLLVLSIILSGCFSYSFQGGSIPPGVNSIFIAFFPDQSQSGQGTLSDQLYSTLENRFVNQSSLSLSSSEGNADVILEGVIQQFSDRPFSVASDEVANENRVTITVQATYRYTAEEQPEWSRTFSGVGNYDPAADPVQGQVDAIEEALDQIALDMFNESVGKW